MRKNLIILATIVLSASCANKPLQLTENNGNGAIGVKVSGCNGLTTKAVCADGEYFGSFAVDSIGREVLMIDGYVSDVCPEDWGDGTKGTIITTSSIDKFWMTAYGEGNWHDNTTVTAGSTATLDFVNAKYDANKLPGNAEALRSMQE